MTGPQGHPRGELRVYGDGEQLARAGAELFVARAEESTNARGRFRVALSGGHTPRRIYELLGSAFNSRVDWEKVDFFWSDERYVGAGDRQSNYRMTVEALLQHIPVPTANVRRVPTDIDPASAAAARYEQDIRHCFHDPSSVPQFDLIYLGLGTNGHTASLFPHSPALLERSRLVVADFVAEVNSWRITMTPLLLNRGRTVAFVVEGEQKSDVLREVLLGAHDPERLPAQLISPEGALLWLADEPAARLLSRAEARRSA